MELEHFRPQKYFSKLSNDPKNLVYSCSGCNNLKSDHWPILNGDLEISVTDDGQGFLDPFVTNRKEYFYIKECGEIEEIKAPAKYMIILLALNRESRRKLRELRFEKIKVIEMLDKKIVDFQKFCDQNSFSTEQEVFLRDHLASLVSIRGKFVNCLLLDTRQF